MAYKYAGPRMLYFGYGSNLDADDLARYCRERACDAFRLERVGTAFLPDRCLAFTHRSTTRGGGVLDVPPQRGGAVRGVLFRVVPEDGSATLDRKEGEGHVYLRIETVALREDGTEEPVFAYEVAGAQREPFVAPAAPYLDVVRRGYERHGLSTEPLYAAAAGRRPASPIAGVFVYGTLRRGEERHPALARHGAIGGDAASTRGTLLDLGPYPGLIVDDDSGLVAGELYDAADPSALLHELDAVETFRGFGVPGSLYRRAIVRVLRSGSAPTLAWTYVYAGSRAGSRVIASGDWPSRQLS